MLRPKYDASVANWASALKKSSPQYRGWRLVLHLVEDGSVIAAVHSETGEYKSLGALKGSELILLNGKIAIRQKPKKEEVTAKTVGGRTERLLRRFGI